MNAGTFIGLGRTGSRVLPITEGGRIDPGYARWLLVCHRIVALTAPPDATAQAAGADPPCYLLIIKPAYVTARQLDVLVLLRALLRNSRQQSAHFRLPIPTVTTKGPD